MLREGLEDTLAALDFPETHRRRLHSTNLLESLMKRVKQRTKVVGVFPNRASCDRLVGTVLLKVDERWSLERSAYLEPIRIGAPSARGRARPSGARRPKQAI